LKLKEAKDTHASRQAASMSKLRNDENKAEHRRRLKLISESKSFVQSQDALHWAYNQGLEQTEAGPVGPDGPDGRRVSGPSRYESQLNMGRLKIEGGRSEESNE
jgi:hypothetical protein